MYHVWSEYIQTPITDKFVNPPRIPAGYRLDAYTTCDSVSSPHIYVRPDLDHQLVPATIMHEFGHVMECEDNWGFNWNTQEGERVADAVTEYYGNKPVYNYTITQSDRSKAVELINRYGVSK